MQAVDEVVCLVEFSTQLGLLAVMKGATANRPGRTTAFSRFDPARYLRDMLVERSQQHSSLGLVGVLDHLRMVSPSFNVRR